MQPPGRFSSTKLPCSIQTSSGRVQDHVGGSGGGGQVYLVDVLLPSSPDDALHMITKRQVRRRIDRPALVRPPFWYAGCMARWSSHNPKRLCSKFPDRGSPRCKNEMDFPRECCRRCKRSAPRSRPKGRPTVSLMPPRVYIQTSIGSASNFKPEYVHVVRQD